MKYRRFGKTELDMPVLTAGGMRFQASWKADETDKITQEGQANVEACLRRALEQGINHFETARGYGTSELQMGRAMRDLPRDEIILQTKVGPTKKGKEFLQQFDDSLERLQVDSVDLLAIHGINTDEKLAMTLARGGPLEAAERLREAGRTRHVGFSTHGPTDVIVKTIATDRFEYVNLHWFWIQQDRWPAIEAAKARDMGVFIISPSDKGGRLYEPSDKIVRLCRPLSPIAFNDLFCLKHEEVHTISIGARRPSDYDEHIRAVEMLDDPQADRLVRQIGERLTAEFRTALGEEWYATWSEGLPDWPDTPGEVNIPFILWLYNLAKALDLVKFGRDRYGLLGNSGDWVPGKKLGDVDPRDLADALSRSPHAERIPAVLAEAHAMFAGKEGKPLQEK
ncbi:MAG: aldo/keto reductase [Phycisphaerae bacterium]